MLVALGMLFALGCGKKEPAPPIAGPAWTYKGSGAFDVDKGKIFYGVGIASGIKNRALLFSTSDNRARAEVAKVLETYVASLAKDYMASTTAGDMSASSEEQHVEQALKSFSKTTLHGARIIDHWIDPSDGSVFALCEMDLLAFKEALDEYRMRKNSTASSRRWKRSSSGTSFFHSVQSRPFEGGIPHLIKQR
jgi:hypothetical protein